MASCVRNILTKIYQNLITGFQVTVKNVGDAFFETQCTHIFCVKITSTTKQLPTCHFNGHVLQFHTEIIFFFLVRAHQTYQPKSVKLEKYVGPVPTYYADIHLKLTNLNPISNKSNSNFKLKNSPLASLAIRNKHINFDFLQLFCEKPIRYRQTDREKSKTHNAA